jgi:hypothetical protein
MIGAFSQKILTKADKKRATIKENRSFKMMTLRNKFRVNKKSSPVPLWKFK